MMTYRGYIQSFHGSWMSGIAQLMITRADGVTALVPCENAPTVRALEACFGDVITPGHTATINDEIRKREVVYTTDEFGLLVAFTPVEEWPGPEIPTEGISDDDLEQLMKEGAQ